MGRALRTFKLVSYRYDAARNPWDLLMILDGFGPQLVRLIPMHHGGPHTRCGTVSGPARRTAGVQVRGWMYGFATGRCGNRSRSPMKSGLRGVVYRTIPGVTKSHSDGDLVQYRILPGRRQRPLRGRACSHGGAISRMGSKHKTMLGGHGYLAVRARAKSVLWCCRFRTAAKTHPEACSASLQPA